MTIRIWMLALLLAGCEAAPRADRRVEAPQAVRTIRVETRPVGGTIDIPGTLVAREEVQVTPDQIGHRVLQVMAEEGDRVVAGQALAALDPGPLIGELERTRIAARRAVAERRRIAGLAGQGVLTDEALEQRAFDADSTLATLRDIERRHARLVLRTPVDGVVISRRIERGEVTTTGGDPAFRVARRGEVEVEAAIGESDLALLKTGARAIVSLGDGTTLAGHVRRVGTRIDPRSLAGTIRIALPVGTDPVFGASARATVGAKAIPRPAVPETAIRYEPGGASVMLVDEGGRVRRVRVQPGVRDGGWVALQRGPRPGTRILADGGALVLPGDRVRAMEAPR